MKELERFLDDARQGARRHVDLAERERSFADVVARAQALGAVPADAEVPATPTGIVELRTHRPAPVADEGALDELIADARTAVGRNIARRRLDPVPAAPIPAPARKRRLAWVAVGALSAAAVLIGALSLAPALLFQRSATAPADQSAAAAMHEDGATTGDTIPRASAPVRPPTKRAPPPRAPEGLEPDAPALDVPEIEPVIEPFDVPPAERGSRHRARLQAWATEAQERWKAGELDGARALFEKVVAQGGRSRQAEMAYADLLSLARQRGRDAERVRLWKAYLARFPRGRFADDARAGLCREATGDAQRRCWQRYLDDFARGSYRAEAERKNEAP